MTSKRYETLRHFLDDLSQFEAGGRGLAMAVADGAPIPPSETKAVGGAEEAVQWFKSRLTDKSQRPSMLFLVGAPGNGKSFLLGKILEDLDGVKKKKRDLRSFTVPETESGRSLLVVNDASAPSEQDAPGRHLRLEIEEAIATQSHVHINVNRGVIYQELRSDNTPGAITSLFTWISKMSLTSEDEYLRSDYANGDSSIRIARLAHGETEFDIVVVYMDFYSIFEIQPIHDFHTSGEWVGLPKIQIGQSYSIAAPSSRSRGSREYWEKTPAGGLLTSTLRLASPLLSSRQDGFHVLEDNVRALNEDGVFCGFLSILRNTEIATSQHISFRELWTAIGLAIIGDQDAREAIGEAELGQIKPGQWADMHASACPVEEPERLRWLMSMASVRTHQSLFGAIQLPGRAWVNRSLSPILNMTIKVDPVNDVRILENSDGGTSSQLSPVAESMRGQVGDTSILDLLSEMLAEIGINLTVTNLDKAVDASVREIIGRDFRDEPCLSRVELESVLVWYGDYLTRLLSLSCGRTGFMGELEAWVEAWSDAKSQAVSQRLRDSIVNLLLPMFNMQDPGNSGERLITLLSARTEAVTSSTDRPRLAVRLGAHPILRSAAHGDRLSIQIVDNANKLLIDLVADFDFVREALTRQDWFSAFTDNTDAITPKIERFRAQLLRDSDFLSNVRLISGATTEKVSLV